MNPPAGPDLQQRSVLAFERMSAHETSVVLDSARTLQRAARYGRTPALQTPPLPQTPLRGKNLGLLSEADDGDAALFRQAATELGAHVAQIRPSLSGLSTPQEVQHTARMLGRLYDAVECQGMAAALVQQVGVAAGVPVYDGIAGQGHPTARLAALLGGDSSAVDNRRFVLQAVLLCTMS